MALEVYFSHSWAPADVGLNVFVWETVAPDCELYVDREGAETGVYYINRLEELIRKSAIFISVLAYRGPENSGDQPSTIQKTEDGRPDYRLACSPGSLFEVRLAERARKPRWIIYDDRTGFVPPDVRSDLVVYTAITAAEELERGGRTIHDDGTRWLKRVREMLNASAPQRARRAALLMDDAAADAADVRTALAKALQSAGYNQVAEIESVHTDAEAMAILQSSGLLVAEIGAASVGELYGMAHALFIPTIRFIRSAWREKDVPRLLDGHPGGYQHDLILVENAAVLAGEVRKRAEAMRDSRAPINGLGAGSAYFRRKLYRPHRVFISHNIGAPESAVINALFASLQDLGVRAWEYRHNNQAGIVWKDELQTALSEATDFVFIFAKDYELSEACVGELRTFVDRRSALKSVTPFLWGDRVRPNPELSTLHHESLPSDPAAAAAIVVERLVPKLRMPAATPQSI